MRAFYFIQLLDETDFIFTNSILPGPKLQIKETNFSNE